MPGIIRPGERLRRRRHGGDAHLKPVRVGPSETIPRIDGRLGLSAPTGRTCCVCELTAPGGSAGRGIPQRSGRRLPAALIQPMGRMTPRGAPTMPKLSPTLQRKLVAVGIVLVLAAGVALALTLRQGARQRRVDACRQKRTEISRFRKQTFDTQLDQMRRMRLNPEQVSTLRRVDPAAYARYAQAYGDQVDRVAQAADRLGTMVDAYRAADCLAVE